MKKRKQWGGRNGYHTGSQVSFWTGEKDIALRDMLLEKKTTTQIAEILGTTKNAVIGRSHRLMLVTPKVKKKKSKKIRRLEDLKPDQCRYALNDEAPYHFCGKKQKAGKPYCERHCDVAYRKFEPRNYSDAS